MPNLSERAPDPRPARTRAAIFAAARDLGADDGEVTVNALAKRAGVSRAAFYSHFTGLDDLMGAMLQDMFDAAWQRGRLAGAAGRTMDEHVQHGFAMLVAYVERHHAFLRGALDWKFTHRTYMILVETVTELHVAAMAYVGEDVPAVLKSEESCRAIAGAALAQCARWLVDTDAEWRAGVAPDATGLLETILRFAPSWYTGLGLEDPVPAERLMAECRTYGQDEPAGA